MVIFYARVDNHRNGFELGIESLKLVKEYFKDKIGIFCVGSEFDVNKYGLNSNFMKYPLKNNLTILSS